MSAPTDQGSTTSETVGGVIADVLAAAGTSHFFLLTGGDNAFFLELQRRGIQPVLARTERSAAFMADAYARLTGRPAFVYGQFGPGAAVVLSGLIDSLYGRSPVVALCSEVKSDVLGRFAYQELDQLSMFRPVTKYAVRMERSERAVDMVQTAMRESMQGSPGPTYVGVPSDLLLAPGTAAPAAPLPPRSRPRPDAEGLARAAELIGASARPVLLVGAGAHVSGCYAQLDAFAARHDIPVLTTVGGKGVVVESVDYAHGVAGRYSRRSANLILREADLVIAVGTRLSDMSTDRLRAVSSAQTLIHVDIDPSALGRNLVPDVGIVADAATFLDDLSPLLGGLRCTDWAETARVRTRSWLAERTEVVAADDGLISPMRVMTELRNVMADTDILVSDTGYMAAWSAALFDTRRAGRYYLRTAGSLGWGLPAGIGAQLAAPDQRVVAITGDGGVGYHFTDIETAVRLSIPVVVVILNNGTLAFERHAQQHDLGTVSPTLTDFVDVDYAAAARAFGAGGVRVDKVEDLEPALRAALASDEPVVLDVRVDPAVLPPVTNFDAVGRIL